MIERVPADSERLRPLLTRLTLEQKAQLVQGADFWTTTAIPEIGLRAMTMSDGPAGVRGPHWDEREPSLSLPSGSALAASWDERLAYRYGAVLAAEARRKGVDIVLGPTINLQRTPLGGRHFECLSEDPELTASIGAAFIRGMQNHGVAATPKHYVANDSETDRFNVNVLVDDRALRELYLVPFERAVEVGAWTVMSAYNSVDGVTMSENDLLSSPLKTEWGFDGVVISDWTAVRSLGAATAAQDLAMPGPCPAWHDLADAVRDGKVDESDLDLKALRILLLAERVGALSEARPHTATAEDGPAFALEAAEAGTVLLTNDGLLPIERASISRIAVIGHNALLARTQGGGSATVLPESVVSPLDGIRRTFPDAEVRFEIGAVVQQGVSEIPLDRISNPRTGDLGIRVSFLGPDGAELYFEDRRSTALVWFGGDAPITASRRVVFECAYRPIESGEVQIGFAGANPARLYLDDRLVLDDAPEIVNTDLGAAFLNPPSVTVSATLEADVAVMLRLEIDLADESILSGGLSATLGFAADLTDPEELIARAGRAAGEADVAVVVVGTSSKVESEGYDREDLDLPGLQDELIRAVALTGTPTVVIVNAGSPVLLPWADDVSAVLQGFFGGQAFGTSIARILAGDAEPGGRLPTTWPARFEDVPILEVEPRDGKLAYAEGIHIGYRAWDEHGVTPAFPFGHGLGYTSWRWDAVEHVDGGIAVSVTNVGPRTGKAVVQAYAERSHSVVDRPSRWLVGFATASAVAGETTTLLIPLPPRRFSHWDGSWRVEPGPFRVRVGASVADLPLETTWSASG